MHVARGEVLKRRLQMKGADLVAPQGLAKMLNMDIGPLVYGELTTGGMRTGPLPKMMGPRSSASTKGARSTKGDGLK